jgi:hypothetical protein
MESVEQKLVGAKDASKQKLLEAKETIKKMQSGTERETELKAFVNHVEGCAWKGNRTKHAGNHQKCSMELFSPEEEDGTLKHSQKDVLLVASWRMKEIVPNN